MERMTDMRYKLEALDEHLERVGLKWGELFDTHCHPIEEELMRKVLARGIKVLLLIADKRELEYALKFKGFPNVFFGVGVHPHEASDFSLKDIDELFREVFEVLDRVAAVGEIGLDLYYSFTEFHHQKQVFEHQVRLAKQLDLPMSIHSRKAEREVLKVLDEVGYHKGVLHSYTGPVELLDEALGKGMYIGVNGIVTFKKAEEVREIVRQTPISRLLLETDSPYLAPVPFRGKVNTPLSTLLVALKVSEVKGIPVEDVVRTSTGSAKLLFEGS